MKAYSLFLAMNLAFLSCACLLHCRAVETGPSAGLAAPDTLVVEQQTVSDSLLQLIAGASVRRAVTTGFDSDSKTLVSQKKSLSKSSREQFKFLLSDKANFKSDDTVFGQFMPSVSVRMKSKGRKLKISLDFGLGKWSLTDLKTGQEWQYDLRSKELLRWAWLQFPDDNLLKTLYLSQE